MNTVKKFEFENLPQDFSLHTLPEILKLAKKIKGDAALIYERQGDLNMVRTTTIASGFDADVVDYVQKRRQCEDKDIKLLRYETLANSELRLFSI